jgi:hypothetical protein
MTGSKVRPATKAKAHCGTSPFLDVQAIDANRRRAKEADLLSHGGVTDFNLFHDGGDVFFAYSLPNLCNG